MTDLKPAPESGCTAFHGSDGPSPKDTATKSSARILDVIPAVLEPGSRALLRMLLDPGPKHAGMSLTMITVALLGWRRTRTTTRDLSSLAPFLGESGGVKGLPKRISPHLGPLPEGEETSADPHGAWMSRCSTSVLSTMFRKAHPPLIPPSRGWGVFSCPAKLL